MAVKKQSEPPKGLVKIQDKLLVQKSTPLYGLSKSDLTLAEFKILDVYLSRINSHNPENRTVSFEKGELEAILGVNRIRTEELDERLKHLMTTIKIEDDTKSNKFKRVALFEKAEVEQDEYGQWKVELMCTPSAMEYFFNIENLGYLIYKLKCITMISSRYTYIMFLYLEANKFRKTWTIELEELKTLLNCQHEESYKKFKVFNDRILKLIKKEMDEKTDCRYQYDTVKKGKNVVAVKFTYLGGGYIAAENIAETEVNSFEDDSNCEKENWEKQMWIELFDKYNFTKEQLYEITQILVDVPDCFLPADLTTYSNDYEFRRYHYLSQKLARMETVNKQKKIANKFNYILKMLKQDAGIL